MPATNRPVNRCEHPDQPGWASAAIRYSMFAYLALMPLGQSAPAGLRTVILAVLAGGVVADRLGLGRAGGEPMRYQLVPLAGLFLASAMLSIAFSSDARLSLNASMFLPTALLFFLGAQHLRTTHDRRALGAALALALLVLSVDCLHQSIRGVSLFAAAPPFRGRMLGSVPHPNDLALIPLLLPLVLLAPFPRRSWWTVARGVLTVLCIISVMLSQSRNAVLGLGLGLVVWMVLTRQWRLGMILTVSAAVILAGAYVVDLGAFRGRVASLATFHHEGRLGIWMTAWTMFLDAPWLGQGPHLFGERYLDVLTTINFPAWYEPEYGWIPWAHNIYLEMLAERGVIGGAAFLAVIGGASAALAGARADAQSRPGAIAVAISLAVFLGMGIADLTFLKDWVQLIFWMLVGLAASLARPSSRDQHQQERGD